MPQCRLQASLTMSKHTLRLIGKGSVTTLHGHTLKACNFKATFKTQQWTHARPATRLLLNTTTHLRRHHSKDSRPKCWEPIWKTKPIDGSQSTKSRLVRSPWISKINRRKSAMKELLALRTQYITHCGLTNVFSNLSVRALLAAMVAFFLLDLPQL